MWPLIPAPDTVVVFFVIACVTLKHFLLLSENCRRVDFHARLGMVSWAARPCDCSCGSRTVSLSARCGQQLCWTCCVFFLCL